MDTKLGNIINISRNISSNILDNMTGYNGTLFYNVKGNSSQSKAFCRLQLHYNAYYVYSDDLRQHITVERIIKTFY